MKKNITINLFGQLYNIDEDAYELLNNYEESLRHHFSKQEDGAEIFNDIEARIAELLSEQKAKGVEAISIEHVQDIIKRIGAPEEIGNEEMDSDEAGQSRAEGAAPKRLYRDMENKLLAGVLAGFANYFGGDRTWWRIGFILICVPLFGFFKLFHIGFMNLGPVIAYVVLAILLPSAATPEERLKMKGKAVNPQTLANEVTNEAQQKKDAAAGTDYHRNARGCVAGFFSILVAMFQLILIIVCSVACVAILFMLLRLYIVPQAVIGEYFREEQLELMQHPELFWTLGVCALVACLIPIYCAVHGLMKKTGRIGSMGILQRVFWMVLWLAAVGGCVFAMKKISEQVRAISNQKYQSHIHVQDGMKDGFYFHDEEWKYYQDNHWKLLQAENCLSRRYTNSGKYFTGDRRVRYLDAYDPSGNLLFQAERTEKKAPGHYRLTCNARADNWGAFIYAETAMGRDSISITPLGNEGGNIWQMAVDYVAKVSEAENNTTEKGHLMKRISEANNGNGFGWTQTILKDIEVGPDSLVRYGVYANSELSVSDSNRFHWFSATDFTLTPVEY
jgi:phage shock protein PspC (stress-responsive transcriptional regulator)